MKYVNLILFACLVCITISMHAQKVGLLMDNYVIDRWHLDQKFFTERIEALGGKCVVEVPYGDPVEQVRLGKKLIADSVDVLVIIPTDAKKAEEIVKAAKAANIPVISYDRLITSKDLRFYISYNSIKVGHLQAQYAVNKMPGGNYLLINGPPSDNNAILFRNGQLSVLQSGIQAGKIKLIGDYVLNDWSELEALMKVDEFFSSSDVKPNVILAANDAIATGALQSIPKELLGKIIITGQDADLTAIKNIVAGVQTMTVYKPIKPLAYKAAEVAMKLAKDEAIPNTVKLKNGDFEVDAILLNPSVVDKSNYKETVVKDGHVTMADILEKQ